MSRQPSPAGSATNLRRSLIWVVGRRRSDGQATGAVRSLAIATVLLLALLLAIQTVSEFDTFGVRAIGVVAVLYVLATVLIPLLRLVERPDG